MKKYSNNSYFENYKHPKWQKKRLEILKQSGFRCSECDNEESMLHIHHGYYQKGLLPWDYPNETLRCLCEKCHKERHELQEFITYVLATLSYGDLKSVYGYALASANFLPDIDLTIDDYSTAEGVGAFYHVNPDDVVELAEMSKDKTANTTLISNLRRGF